MKKWWWILVVVLVVVVALGYFMFFSAPVVTNFEECVLAGNPVMESYPRQCIDHGVTFVEQVGTRVDETDGYKIVYGTETVDDTAYYELDCKRLGGKFETCGSPCAKGKICAAVCAYTCEGLS